VKHCITSHRLLAGIDGGQSGIRCLIMREDGEAYGYGESSGIDFLLAPGGRDRSAGAIAGAVSRAMSAQRQDQQPIYAGFLGLSGVVPGGELGKAALEIGSQVLGTERVSVDNDGITAQAGALGLAPGLIAIAGSGSLVVGVDASGARVRAGGWGYVFGDEAGAFGIAVSAIKLALRDLDSGIVDSPLAAAILEHLSETDLNAIVKKFYAAAITRPQIAGLTAALARLAGAGELGDQVHRIFEQAAVTLARQMVQAASRLNWEDNTVRWAPVGGVFKSGELFTTPLQEELARQSQLKFQRVEPQLPPVAGAALMAYRQWIGPVPASVIERLQRSVAEYL
jgi:N-acetylglucosamine kinase-like BadF-type ATPase